MKLEASGFGNEIRFTRCATSLRAAVNNFGYRMVIGLRYEAARAEGSFLVPMGHRRSDRIEGLVVDQSVLNRPEPLGRLLQSEKQV
jgi:hypothetical protein